MIVRSFSNSESPGKVLIALHGWTGNVSSMEPVVNAWELDDVKWVLAQAPYIAADGGFTWFDGNEDIGWKYQDSFDILSKLISELNDQGFPNHAIYILGFSQGACLSMEFMIRQRFSLGGIIPIAGFIRYKERFKQEIKSWNGGMSEVPVVMLKICLICVAFLMQTHLFTLYGIMDKYQPPCTNSQHVVN